MPPNGGSPNERDSLQASRSPIYFRPLALSCYIRNESSNPGYPAAYPWGERNRTFLLKYWDVNDVWRQFLPYKIAENASALTLAPI